MSCFGLESTLKVREWFNLRQKEMCTKNQMTVIHCFTVTSSNKMPSVNSELVIIQN
jgi:hypothetical protein